MDRRNVGKFGIGTATLVLVAALIAVAAAGCGDDVGAAGGSLNLGRDIPARFALSRAWCLA